MNSWHPAFDRIEALLDDGNVQVAVARVACSNAVRSMDEAQAARDVPDWGALMVSSDDRELRKIMAPIPPVSWPRDNAGPHSEYPTTYWGRPIPPPALRRQVRWIKFSGAGIALIMAAGVLLIWPWGLGLVELIAIGFIICVHLAVRIHVRRFARATVAADFARCLICGYRLTSLPEQSRCPECGTGYRLEKVQGAWKYYVERALKNVPPREGGES